MVVANLFGGAERRWHRQISARTPSASRAHARAAIGQLVADPTIRAGNFQSKLQRFPPEPARAGAPWWLVRNVTREQRGLWVQLGQLGR